MANREVTLGGQVIELVEPTRFATVTRPVPEGVDGWCSDRARLTPIGWWPSAT